MAPNSLNQVIFPLPEVPIILQQIAIKIEHQKFKVNSKRQIAPSCSIQKMKKPRSISRDDREANNDFIVPHSEEDLQLQRLMERCNFNEEKAKVRISAQMPLDKKVEMANFVVENSSTEQDTKEQTIKIINVLKYSKHHWRLRFVLGFCCTIVLAGAYWFKNRSAKAVLSA